MAASALLGSDHASSLCLTTFLPFRHLFSKTLSAQSAATPFFLISSWTSGNRSSSFTSSSRLPPTLFDLLGCRRCSPCYSRVHYRRPSIWINRARERDSPLSLSLRQFNVITPSDRTKLKRAAAAGALVYAWEGAGECFVLVDGGTVIVARYNTQDQFMLRLNFSGFLSYMHLNCNYTFPLPERLSKTQEAAKVKLQYEPVIMSVWGDAFPSANVPYGHPSRAVRGVEPWTDDGGGGWTTDARTADDGLYGVRTHMSASASLLRQFLDEIFTQVQDSLLQQLLFG